MTPGKLIHLFGQALENWPEWCVHMNMGCKWLIPGTFSMAYPRHFNCDGNGYVLRHVVKDNIF